MLAVLMRKRRQQQSNRLLWRRSAFVESVEIQPLAGAGRYVPGPWRTAGKLERHSYSERTPLVAAGDQERQTDVPGDPYLPEVYSALAQVSLQNLMPFGRPATTSLPQP